VHLGAPAQFGDQAAHWQAQGDHALSQRPQFPPLGGPIFETVVLLEIVKAFVNRGEEPQIHFWRTSAGVEVDLIVEAGGKLIPIEVKLSATPRPAMASGIRAFQEDLGEKAGPGFVVHPGDVRLPLAPKVVALPFSEL
jgi:hypothetical protein